MMNKVIYWTLIEIAQQEEWSENSFYSSTLKTILGTSVSMTENEEDIMDMVMFNVFNKWREFYIYRKEFGFFDEIPTLESSDISLILNRLCMIIQNTYSRYIPLIESYNLYKSNPTAKISSESSSKSRYNDTPQGVQDNADYYNDGNHATNFTSSFTKTDADVDDIPTRLDKLYKNWRDIMRDWTNEFKGIFMEVFQ